MHRPTGADHDPSDLDDDYTREALSGASGLTAPAGPALDLQALDAWEAPRSLRRYQRLIVEGRPFALRLDERLLHFRWCRAEGGRNLIELEEHGSGRRFCLSSDLCGSGYRLTDQPLRPGSRVRAALPGKSALVRVGHGNFAHFLWNELDALLQVAQSGPVQVVQDHVSVLDVGQLEAVELRGQADLDQQPSLHLGSMVVTPRARQLVLMGLGVPAEAPVRADDGQVPSILVGVRGPGKRELVNEVPVLIHLIQTLRRVYPSARILLDGFTYQCNNRRDPNAQRRASAVHSRITEILTACGSNGIAVLSGLEIGPALREIRQTNYYITHEGTMQHKIGWFFPWIPGLCLCGPEHPAGVARWHQIQCLGAVAVDSLPAHLLAYDRLGQMEQAGQSPSRNRPFRITDPERAVRHIIETARRHLG